LHTEPVVGLTIAGGGCRTLFSLGVGYVLQQEGIKFHSMSATSAGSAVALNLASNMTMEAYKKFIDTISQNKSNFYFKELLRGKRPFPHEVMYREILKESMDVEVIKKSGIALAFNALKLPSDLYPHNKPLKRNQVLVKLIKALVKEYSNSNKGYYLPIVPTLVKKLGLVEEIFTVDKEHSLEDVVDIALKTSSAPPLLSFQKTKNGEYYLDGSFLDNLPITHHPKKVDLNIAIYYDAGSKELIKTMGRDRGQNLFYVYPDRPVPASMFDYTNAKQVQQTFEMGLEQGENMLRFLKAFVT